jgi:hypothetical protein
MANIDGGHYFLTTLIPVKREPVRRADGSFTSPSHLLREALGTLPTAQQSPACVAAGLASPFSRCTRTHFVRAVVIDQPMYNGRDGGNALVQGLRNVNLLVHEPVDNLSSPYLMFTADLDARSEEADGGLRSWAVGLWEKLEPELRAVFSPCVGFDQVGDGEAFAAWLERCQLDTTMSFNDYGVPTPELHGYTMKQVSGWVVAGTLGLSVFAFWTIKMHSLNASWLLVAAPLAALVSVGVSLWLLWRKGCQPFPPGENTDLPSILKSLHVQQRFALLAAQLQGADAATIHAQFGQFLQEVRPGDTAAPTQPPGVIRSDGVPLVEHQAVVARQVTV